VAHVRARDGESQIDEHASVERQIFDGSRFDHFAQTRVGRPQYIG